jgi:serine/threonine protein kinase
MDEGTEIIERIPPAPPLLPPGRPKNCKIVIASGKVEEGYCIVGEELTRSGENYVLPGTELVIDKISANLFRYPDIKAFVAVRKSKGVYALKPLRESDYKKYVKGELSSKDVKVKYEPPESKYEGSYGSVTIHPTEEIAVKKSKSEGGTGELEKDMVVEIGCYRLLSQIACLPRMYNFTPGVQIHIEFEKGQVLSEVMEQNLDLNTKRALMFRAAKCLRTIASQGCIHCDLKPPNMVVSSSGQVLIIDWGMAKIDQRPTANQGYTNTNSMVACSGNLDGTAPKKIHLCCRYIFPWTYLWRTFQR